MRAAFAVMAFALLVGCKPPKFDRTVSCPLFHAAGVAVYDWHDNGLFVLYPDGKHTVVDRTECLIEPR